MTATAARTATILDKFRRPLRDLRISVTDRCNFRCSYCMPAEIFGDRYQFLPKNDLLTFEEIARATRILAELGVVKARLTGGEPLVRSEIEKACGAAGADRGHRRPDDDHKRIPAAAESRRAPQRRAAAADGQPGHA